MPALIGLIVSLIQKGAQDTNPNTSNNSTQLLGQLGSLFSGRSSYKAPQNLRDRGFSSSSQGW